MAYIEPGKKKLIMHENLAKSQSVLEVNSIHGTKTKIE